MLKIKRTGRFESDLIKICHENSTIIESVREKIHQFVKNQQDTRLDSHPLTGRMEGKWAFCIDNDVRIVYEWLGKNSIRFLAIGSHKEVYKAIKKASIN